MAKHTYKGIKLRSGLEKSIAQQLDTMGVKWEYEPFKIEWRRVVPMGICSKCAETRVYQRSKYIPDFVTGSGVILEVKGRLTSRDRTKLAALKSQHPEVDLRIVFGANNKITKNKQERYMDWARKMKIKAALKEVPSLWKRDLVELGG